jgi:hypothetical protein
MVSIGRTVMQSNHFSPELQFTAPGQNQNMLALDIGRQQVHQQQQQYQQQQSRHYSAPYPTSNPFPMDPSNHAGSYSHTQWR